MPRRADSHRRARCTADAAAIAGELRGEAVPDPIDAIVVSPSELRDVWEKLVRSGGDVSRNYAHHLIERIEIDDGAVRIVPRVPTA